MGRAPCCEKVGLKRGRWTTEEDDILTKYIQAHGEGSWRSLPKNAGLLRCGKSCRLRWINYLRSDLRRGNISFEEEETIIKLHASLGNRWSLIASHLPGRTDNEIKNYWNSHLSKKIDSVPSSNQAQQQEQTDVVNLPKPAGNNTNKSTAGRTAMKKKKNKFSNISTTICDPPLVPKLLEKAEESVSSELENGNGIVPMPATPTMEEETVNIGSMLLESNEEDKEIMGGICLDSSCFNDMALDNIDGSLEDLEVGPNGVLATLVTSGPILEEGNKMAMLMSDQEDLEIDLSPSNGVEINGEWRSCYYSTNSHNMNEEDNFWWGYWDLDGGVQTGQELLDSNIEEDNVLSWLWDTTDNYKGDDLGDCTSNKVESEIL